jgi:hypothetical protein
LDVCLKKRDSTLFLQTARGTTQADNPTSLKSETAVGRDKLELALVQYECHGQNPCCHHGQCQELAEYALVQLCVQLHQVTAALVVYALDAGRLSRLRGFVNVK